MPHFAGGAMPGRGGVRSLQQAQIGGAGLHCVDDQLIAAVEAQHDDLEHAAGCVEPRAELAGGAALIRFAGVGPVGRGVDGVLGADAVLERGGVDLHAT